LFLAYGILGDLGGPPNPNADITKDGAVNSADQLMMAFMIMPAGQCPNGGPDLVVDAMWIELETGGGCYVSTTLGVRARVRNQGNAPAGPSLVGINGTNVAVSGLAAGATTMAWVPGYEYPDPEVAIADVTLLVAESDETDNTYIQYAPIPTLPPACTSTPTATPTP
jgi:hypothetical protein